MRRHGSSLRHVMTSKFIHRTPYPTRGLDMMISGPKLERSGLSSRKHSDVQTRSDALLPEAGIIKGAGKRFRDVMILSHPSSNLTAPLVAF